MFIPQSPAESDVLFASVPGFLANLDMIADHIAEPSVTGNSSRPMTFAIYGQWGAGKSTALRQLQALAEHRVADSGGMVSRSHYSAPVWQSINNAQATLAYTILRDLDKDAVFRLVRDEASQIAMPGDDDDSESRAFFRLAEAFREAPALYQQWMRSISTELKRRKHPHVVFVDDLDRCSIDFTAAVLAATTFWDTPGQINLFFVLAASEQHLLDALSANLPLGTHTPAQALEKYVHLSVTVPPMLTSPSQVASYLVALAHAIRSPSVSSSHLDSLTATITDSATSYPNCVMAPLLRVADDLTPRAVKHRFNTFLAEFRPHQQLSPSDLKQWVIKAFWPEMWWRYFWPLGRVAETGAKGVSGADYLAKLTDFGHILLPLWGLGDDLLVPALTFLAEREAVDLRGAPPALAMYLAADPAWSPPLTPDEFETLSDKQRLTESASMDDLAQDSPSLEVLRLYFEADQHRDSGNESAARRLLEKIASQAQRGLLRKDSASVVGNAALMAESLGLSQLAGSLHTSALELDPDHYNVMQNYVEWVIDDRREDLYSKAETLLGLLHSAGSAHKPERTKVLTVRLRSLTGARSEALSDTVDELVSQISVNPSTDLLRQLLLLGPGILNSETVRSLCRLVAEGVDSDPDRYVALRMFGDELANSSDEADERVAVEVYRFVLETGLACLANDDGAIEVWHNLASLYGSLGYPSSAGQILLGIYHAKPSLHSARRALAVVLDRLGHDKAAAAVLLGQVLPEVELPPEDLPSDFAPNAHKWWPELNIGTHSPCALPSLPNRG